MIVAHHPVGVVVAVVVAHVVDVVEQTRRKETKTMKKIIRLLSICMILTILLGTMTVYAVDNNDIVDTSNHTYTFQEMEEDIKLLTEKHPDKISVSTVGTSVDGRALYQVVLGNKNAKNAIYIQSTIHGREWMNTWIMLEQLELCCDNWNMIAPHGITYGEVFNNCCIYLLPMVNPDGVTISQLGIEAINREEIRKNLYNMPGANNPKRWKANADGVDLNRQFSYGWNTRIDVNGPASENFNGLKAFTEPEALAMKSAMAQREFVAAITYHSMEGAIYWDLGQTGVLRDKVKALATHCHNITGYKYGEVSPCKGLEYNYMNFVENTPMVCIETGTVQCPLPYSQFNKLWKENHMLFVALAGCYQ
ncbi:MAG: hypothetical protein J6A59_14110 [Lachnospiraceae bacterium]|nr:hypothetical protein [Lachnospiraceae bacterium]